MTGDYSIANLVLAPDERIEMAFRRAWFYAEDRGRRADGRWDDSCPPGGSLTMVRVKSRMVCMTRSNSSRSAGFVT